MITARFGATAIVAGLLVGSSVVHCGGGDSNGGPADDGGGGGDGSATPDGGGGGDGSMIGDAYMTPDTGVPIEAGDPGMVDITFDVHANMNVHAISPYIYGLNDGSQAAATHATIVRSGGNRLTAFNWENNASNAGSDYQFENDGFLCTGAGCDAPGTMLKSFVDSAVAAGAAALVTVPIVDYVSADKAPAGDVRNSGSNYLTTRFKQNKAAKGSAFANPPNTADAFVYQDEMVNWLKATYPNAKIHYLLDNEPDLWSSTHAEIHPTPVTYDELKTRNVAYATAIKAVVPTAMVWGPVSYGWAGYTNLQGASDANGRDFLDYYLDQMKLAEQAAGKRLVDGLDLHWYPEAQGGGVRIVDPGATPTLVTAREQAPRSLWDSTYSETSWIVQSSTHAPINLLPRMKAKIAAHYPGTKLSFTEWNYGGGATISGVIASADVLGIFGRDGVDMAMMWPMGDESFTYNAFKIFRSYDGQGKAFGDTSVQATTTDVPSSSVYASIDSGNVARMVLVAINKATTDKIAGIRISHSTSYMHANVYTVTAAGGKNVVKGMPLAAVATNAFRYTMPAQSVTLIEPVP